MTYTPQSKNWVYGKYSTGSSFLSEKEQKNEILKNLKKMGISLEQLSNMRVMNIGTGREAKEFMKLGAKFVSHYDYSEDNVERLKKYIRANSIENKMSSIYADIVEYKLPSEQFDLVYVHGVVQHFSHTGKGLLNIINSIKKGGAIWLYFYRSGTFSHFCLSLVRDLISTIKNDYEYYNFASLMSSKDGSPNLLVQGFMDGCFCEYANLFIPQTYISFVNSCGLEIVSSSKLDFLNKHINHKYAHPSVILVCKRKAIKDLSNINIDTLSASKSVDQLNTGLYCGSNMDEIISIINSYKKLRKFIFENNIPNSIAMSLAYRIFGIQHDAHIDYSKRGYYDIENWYDLLKNLFVNCQKNLKLK